MRRKLYYTGGNVQAATNTQLNGLNSAMTGIGNAVAPGAGSIFAAASQIGGSLVDLIDKPDEFGMNSRLGSMWKGSLKGGLPGLVISALNYNKDKKRANNIRAQRDLDADNYQKELLASRINADPELLTGSLTAQYFAYGGQMNNQTVSNGRVKHFSSTAGEFMGKSHEKGGINVGTSAEVEGKETYDNGYVFSRRLRNPATMRSFAEDHKRVAKAIGKIEAKAVTPDRIKSLEYLRGREYSLKSNQEALKELLGLNI